MNEFIAEWTAYCEGKTEHDESDFLGLLSCKWADDDLNDIFRRVPLNQPVIANLKRVYQASEDGAHLYLRPRRENAATPEELATIIVSFIDSQRRFLLKRDIEEEIRDWLKRTDIAVSFVSRDEFRKLVDPREDLRRYILEQEFEQVRYRPEAKLNSTTADCIEHRVMSGIDEALYGLACEFYLAFFVRSPLIDTEIDYGLFFEFWRKGGEYALTDSQILVSSIWNKNEAK